MVELRQNYRPAERAAELVIDEPRHAAGLEEVPCCKGVDPVELEQCAVQACSTRFHPPRNDLRRATRTPP